MSVSHTTKKKARSTSEEEGTQGTSEEVERLVTERTHHLKKENEALRREIAQLKQPDADLVPADQHLQKKDDIYRLLVENSQDVMYSVTEKGIVTYVSPQVTRYGYEPEEVIHRPFLDFIAPEFRSNVLKMFQVAIETGQVFPTEFQVQGKDGLPYWVETYGKTLFDAKGQPVLQVGVLRDITDRKRAEEDLRKSEAKYRTLVETALDIILIHDSEKILYINPTGLKLLGASHPDEILGKHPLEIVHPDFRDRVWDNIAMDLRGENSPITQLQLLRLDGLPLWVEGRGAPTYIGGKPAVQVILRNITDRKRAEENLKESEEQIRSILDRSLDALYRRNLLTGRSDYYSPAIEQITGFSVDEALAMTVDALLERVHPEDRPQVISDKVDASSTGKQGTVDYRFLCKDGTYRWVSDRFKIICDEKGLPLFREGIVRDITERKRAEEALLESESILKSFFDAPGAMRGIVEVVADDDVRHIQDNSVAAALVGLTPDVMKNKLGSELGESRDILRTWIEQYRRSQETGKPVTFEYRDTRNGQKVWLSGIAIYLGTPLHGNPRFAYIVIDITERKQVREALQESEEKYRTLVESFPDTVLIHRKGKMEYINSAGLALFGAKNPEEIIGRSIADLIHPDYHACIMESVARDMRGEPSPTLELLALRLDVTTVPVEGRGRRIIYKGKPALQAVIRDVTERKQAEKALAEQGQYLQAFVQGSPVLTFILNRDHTITMWNQALEEYTGMKADEMIGKAMAWKAFYPSKRPVLADLIVDNAANKIPQWYAGKCAKSSLVTNAYEITQFFPQLKGGTWLFFTAAPIQDADGEIIGAIEILQDITERKQAEETLQNTRDYLDSLIDNANAPIIVWNPDHVITRFNAAFEHLTGYTAAEVIGKELAILFPKESRESSLEKIQRTITEHLESVEIPIRRKDGGIRIALWNSANIYDKDGMTLRATIAQGQDITDRKRAEEELKRYTERLKRSNEDLERFAYISSHDLQEPLRTMVTFTQLLEKRYKGQMDTDVDEYIHYIVHAGKRMQALINDLLEFSRVNTKGMDFRPTDATAIVEEALATLQPQAVADGVSITVDQLPPVLADPGQLRQVFQNLISNALKFRRPDTALEIHIAAQQQDGMVQFSVKDNGIGIEPQYYDRIFIIFQRLHGMDAYEGTGIGLAIVKRIIDRHGGKVWVESEPGKGSTFYFTVLASSELGLRGGGTR